MNLDLPTATLCAAVVILWGLWGFFGKLALERSMPPQAIFLVEAAVGLFMAILFAVSPVNPRPGNGSWSIYGVFSGAALAVGILLYYLALQRQSAGIVVVVTSTYPIVTVFLSYLLLKERLVSIQYAGVALVIVGLCLLLGFSPK
jgi:bacterial/archaeal transporter family protein